LPTLSWGNKGGERHPTGTRQRVIDVIQVQASTTRDRQTAPSTLRVICRLTERLHEEGILYCHWKSNDTLSASLRGHIDLDLLVDRAAAPAFTRLLAEVGFKQRAANPWLTYPAIQHFVALDRPTGVLVHLHVYYRLITGDGRLKSFHLPWEHTVLSTRRFDAARAIYVSDPNIGIILCAIRIAAKLRRGALPFTLHRRLRGNIVAEFRWLSEQVAVTRVDQFGLDLLGQDATRRLLDLLNGPPSLRQWVAFRSSVLAALHPHRRYGPVEGMVGRWLRDAWYALQFASKKWRPSSVPGQSLLTGGSLIAFVGPDGSGKTTVSRRTERWLSPHLDTLPVYFGSGDGTVSLLRLPLWLAARTAGRRARRCAGPLFPQDGQQTVRAAATRSLGLVARALWALTLSYEKRAKLRRAWRAHERGMIVICDRFPQNQVMGFMDGPLLFHWQHSRSRFLRALARWEQAPYAWAEAHPPDLVVRLDVAPEIAVRRKPDMGLAENGKRNDASRSLRYPAQTAVAAVDAGAPLDEVLLEVKGLVWDVL
jgi:hypothetical protein